MNVIGIEGIKVIAPIGVYEEEKALGSKFLVDVYIETNLDIDNIDDDLNKTIDYEYVCNIVKERMNREFSLIETVIKEIYSGIKSEYSGIKKVKIRVRKLNPIGGDKVGSAFIESEF